MSQPQEQQSVSVLFVKKGVALAEVNAQSEEIVKKDSPTTNDGAKKPSPGEQKSSELLQTTADEKEARAKAEQRELLQSSSVQIKTLSSPITMKMQCI